MSELLKVSIETDGGPWAMHDYPCPVFQNAPAVFDMNANVFRPSWVAQERGWRTVRASGWKLWLIDFLCADGV
jgi:hypothetical protein